MPQNPNAPTSRPRLVLIAIALIATLLTLSLAVSGATASPGGITTETVPSSSTESGSTGTRGGNSNTSPAKYERLWDRVPEAEKRWARSTSECESGRDPDAIGYGGTYRGAFQFARKTWDASPKSPGGDPIDFSYRTQAVVAVALKLRDGAGHWPVCG